jgi:hypothetical protein
MEIIRHTETLAGSTGGGTFHCESPLPVAKRKHISLRGFAAVLSRNVHCAFYRERARLIPGPDFGNINSQASGDLGGVKPDARLPINVDDDVKTRGSARQNLRSV